MHDGSAQNVGEGERKVARTGYFSLIDGVRGIAALSVLLYHYVHFFMAGPTRQAEEGVTALFPGYDLLWPLYEYGYLAVQMFWLISGFVFAQVYYGRSAGARNFIANRFARLYPLHILTLLVVTALQAMALHHFGYTMLYGHYTVPHFIEQLFMASDWLRESGGYSFNGPVWSVSVEIVVYALFWISRGWVARLGLTVVLAMVLGFYAANQQWGDISRIFACAFYFFAGCAFNLARHWSDGAVRAVAGGAALVGLVGLSGFATEGEWGLRYLAIPGLGGAIFLLLAGWEDRAPAPLRRACEWLGENTYGIYLWHVPLQLVLLLILMPGIDPAEIAQNWWFLAGFLLLAIAMARVSFVVFERPARDALRRRMGGTPVAAKGGDKFASAR